MTIPRQYQIDSLNDRYGLKVASLLSDAADELSPAITERLRFARSCFRKFLYLWNGLFYSCGNRLIG